MLLTAGLYRRATYRGIVEDLLVSLFSVESRSSQSLSRMLSRAPGTRFKAADEPVSGV